MRDLTLERIWKSRENISRKCDFDARKLVKYYQSIHKKQINRTGKSTLQNAGAF